MKNKSKLMQFCLIAFFTVLCILMVIPFVLLVSISLSREADIAQHGYALIPKHLDFSAYKYIFDNPATVLRAYGVTGFFSIVSMALGVILMALFAYPLSRKNLRGRTALSFFLYFTMLFGGGLVPFYILITQYLNLDNTIWVYIIPSLITPWYVFLMRTFFQGIPNEILESAYLDGADEYTTFIRMIVPLSKPVFASVALFTFLAKWNDWNTAMLYIDEPKLFSLQYLLQKIMQEINLLQSDAFQLMQSQAVLEIPTETVRMAMAVVVAGPALIIFPFFQKYFVKGITVGSVKG